MHRSDQDAAAEPGLFSGMLGTGDIIFMILACAAPMGVLAGIIPLAFAFGNGAGMPGAQLAMCAVMLLFAVGYVRIIPHVRNAGAFYAYIAASLNKEAGIAAAYTAVVAYTCAAASVLGAMSYFAADLFATLTGIATSWVLWAAASIAAIAWLGYHRITMAAKVLTAALLLEVGLIAVIDALILWQRGWAGLDFGSFAPATIFAPGLGIAVIYAINGCIGFEATAIYQEEARNRAVTIPRATYGAVLVLGTFYVLSSWCLVLAVGPAQIKAVAAADPGHLVSGIAFRTLGQFGRDALSLLTITSLFAAALGFFNNIARYFFALSRDGLIPAVLGRVHPRHGSPYMACLALAGILALVIALFALAGLDPLLSLATSLSSMGAVGLEILLTATSLAIPLFFARRGEYSAGKTLAPLLSGVIIAVATWLSLANYATLTGTTLPVINRLPLLFIAIAAAGLAHGTYLRRCRPAIYAGVGSTHVEGPVGE
ncbi:MULTISPECIES: APC family permease [unclassified Novosphingobium]|uniref:APC family permease n=1 Tax=unclassified Novosphingobium TaxID=2644732 RepID=UPI001494220A|nr:MULTISPECIES: APC family permease [unclassified Novosphingobium]MBB3357198.1 amino acid transporter [Novosphingobium sp. BK256]MBB3374140.1 amino acid transporter [Novosphingobium sp. BK280]MBB3378552.1 amino acid transporter [Novosphingobium sp. BK258]MBB3419664.1 amino acid transporter [Novosphingobium sp. BK267]MBB3448015.1 amino acid transporter [Novosphingobium sp. BK352]